MKDETKATYAMQDQKKTYYQDSNTGYAFNQIDSHKYNLKQKEQQMFWDEEIFLYFYYWQKSMQCISIFFIFSFNFQFEN